MVSSSQSPESTVVEFLNELYSGYGFLLYNGQGNIFISVLDVATWNWR